jgi:hypothetical protein
MGQAQHHHETLRWASTDHVAGEGGSAMPKQRVRRIVVDGGAYLWRVRRVDPQWLAVRVWRDGERVPVVDTRIPFDDPWVNYPVMLLAARHAPERLDNFARDPVSPGQVANLIRECAGQEGRSS